VECSHCTANGRKTDADQQLRQSRRVIFGQRMSLDASPSTERAICLLEHDASRHCKIGFMSTIANLEGSLVLFSRQQQGASALRDSDMPPSAMARSQAILPPLSAARQLAESIPLWQTEATRRGLCHFNITTISYYSLEWCAASRPAILPNINASAKLVLL